MSSSQINLGGYVRSLGFSLLEALVALVIFSSVSVSLLSVFNQGLINYGRLETVYQEQMAIRNVSSYLLSQAHSLENGSLFMNGYEVTWELTPIEPERYVLQASGDRSYYTTVLQNVEIVLLGEDRRPRRSQNLRIATYERNVDDFF